ncbi:fluoride efflux transporter FluC [Ketogulonicigenium vulgare]|uniref:Fluoride-specific ion channel FluC n=1 Tax=Ketogulonicigenium vulgare (strain WSH-001) TaxID=759362 RepID=F9Y5A7_KETVW|nr:CrcB family protein [Ketogulonicigenium vulgare]ADO43644.1 CrcB-like protein [Ketogulonicigenium vulgare Y25]AEM41912.1 CrcB-like protein [Ketogulonicigenium vulgare WSH-001]ALJ82015.1 camphor resistance protein CrcB [Ketogulonicigenium vulgare]ANW34650.1 camphor resistance protein CrcB [Ketogulonicigenium vulgare]AOZ55676.1 CrcB-like protein [Ketogulonicigenium vulgare]
MLNSLILIAAGGAIGAVLRALALMVVAAPVGTLVVNVIGSALMGVLWVMLPRSGIMPAFLMTGILGGFTTFSAFSLDSLRLIEAGRPLEALVYMGGSVGLSVLAVFAGAMIARTMI